MYNYYNLYDFSAKEIDQICELTKRWARGDVYLPVDARKLTKQVKDWAKSWNLLEMRGKRFFLTSCIGYQNLSGGVFHVRSLPIEVIWRLVRPMLSKEGSAGYTIVNSKLWMNHFGIAPQNDRFATDRELKEKEELLLLLDAHHYIYFQMAGNVWSISQDERIAG